MMVFDELGYLENHFIEEQKGPEIAEAILEMIATR